MDLLTNQIYGWVQRAPRRIAYRHGSERLTYQALWQGACGIASRLPAGRPIAVRGKRCALTLQCLLACAIAGIPYIPLDPTWPRPRVETILRDSGAGCLLAAEPSSSCLPVIDTIALQDAVTRGVTAVFPERQDDSPFYILYTSGSSGMPKGVAVGHGQLLSFADWAQSLAPAGSTVWLNTASYSFDLSVMAIYPALAAGGTLCDLVPTGDYPHLFSALAASDASVLVATPSFAVMCLADRGFSQTLLPHLQAFLFCGETLSPETALRLMERFPETEIINCYGPTEATVAVTAIRITREMCSEPLPVGYVKPGCRVFIADAHLCPLPDGVKGQIVITGDSVAAYLDSHSEKFCRLDAARAFLSGDTGHMRQGLLYFHGRMDQQMKYHGYRVEPSEIETALLSLEGIRQAAVLPRMRGGIVTGIVAFVAGSAAESQRDLRTQLKDLLPPYMIPNRIIPLPCLPMNANGKCDRKKLMEMII